MPHLRDLTAAREFAKLTYPEDRRLSPIIDKSDSKDILSPLGEVDSGIISALNYVNPYLRRYRSKYTFVNFCASKFRGLIMSRLYSGSWINAMPLQVFNFGYAKFSLAQVMRVFITPNVFNGTSIALNVLIKSLSSSSHSKRFSQKFPKALMSHARNLRRDNLLEASR